MLFKLEIFRPIYSILWGGVLCLPGCVNVYPPSCPEFVKVRREHWISLELKYRWLWVLGTQQHFYAKEQEGLLTMGLWHQSMVFIFCPGS